MSGQTSFNTLPVETLAFIFELAVDQPVCVELIADKLLFEISRSSFSKQPEDLTLVCSHWRKIALGCSYLWSRIDLSADKYILPQLLARAELRVERAGFWPLELYIDDYKCSPHDFTRDYGPLKHFLVRVASRISTLLFVIYSGHIAPFHSKVLELIMWNRSLASFKKLAFIDDGMPTSEDEGHFITSSNENHNDAKLKLRLPNESLEQIFSGLAVLYLEGIFPRWTSSAYHGLVELRLTSPLNAARDTYYCIPESNLVSILIASPGLRTLHFELTLENQTPLDRSVSPVFLQDLESLQICAPYQFLEPSTFKTSSVLRLIAPGSKPLQLYIDTRCRPYEPRFDSAPVKNFFARSRVTKLNVRRGYVHIDQLLGHGYAPSLNTLVTNDCRLEFEAAPSQASSLCSWYCDCSLNSVELKRAVELCPVGLVLYGGWIVGHDRHATHLFDAGLDEEEILAIHPNVRFLSHINNLPLFPVD